jgi:hypothetical protein
MTKNKTTTKSVHTTIQAVPAGADPMDFLRQQMDDCPLCREARARGEVAEIHIGETPIRTISRPNKPFPQRPRWRTLKRRAG